MVQKRNLNQGNDDGSDFPARESKRQHPCNLLYTGLRSYSSPQELALRLEPSIRSWVREELGRVLQSTLRSSFKGSETTQSSAIQLHFDDILPSTLFTCSKVESADNRPIKVVMHDASSNQRITSGPLSSVKVGLVVLNGEFDPNDREDWTEEEFSKKVIRERVGKRPLLTGELVIQLRDGVGYLGDISFTDNSSWIKSRTFRLGLKLINRSGKLRVREGVSKPFTVKDHRGESYRKHYPPTLDDEIWRVEKIAKDGASHTRLRQKGISCVKDFLRLYVTNPSLLRRMLACGISNNTWEKITEHASTCVLDNSDRYIYKATESIVLLFNCIYELVGAILDGQSFPLDKLDVFQKRMVENFKRLAYKNLDCLVLLEDHCLIGQAGQPVLSSDLQIGLPHVSTSSQQKIYCPIEHGEVELQSNSDHTTILPSLDYIVQQDSPTAVSVLQSSHGMQPFNSMASSFLISDPCCSIYPGDYEWGSSGSLESPGMTDFQPPYQLGTPAWPGNGFIASSSIQPASPNSGFHITRRGNPRAIWCTIRAVLKWKTLIKRKVAV